MWRTLARNKKSVTIDLHTAEGQELVRRLAGRADAVIENYRPASSGVLGTRTRSPAPGQPRAGRGAHLRLRPGRAGEDRPGFGRIAQAFGGLTDLCGFPDRAPANPGSATIAALCHSGNFRRLWRPRCSIPPTAATGRGQIVDTALYGRVSSVLRTTLPPPTVTTAPSASAWGTARSTSSPHNHYPTQDSKWVAIACTSDKIFARLAELQGEPGLAGEGRWGKVRDRDRDRAEVDAWVTRWTEQHSLADLIAHCIEFEVPCGPVDSIAEISRTRSTRRARTSSYSRTLGSARSPCPTCARAFPIRLAPSNGWGRGWGSTTPRSTAACWACPRPRSPASRTRA